MGLFGLFKGNKETNNANIEERWTEAYEATPRAYGKEGNPSFIAFVITEDTDTIFPKEPKNMYKIDGESVSEFKLMFFSTTEDRIIGEALFDDAIKSLSSYVVAKKDAYVLTRGLSLNEMQSVIKKSDGKEIS